jgi:hypothetical protein
MFEPHPNSHVSKNHPTKTESLNAPPTLALDVIGFYDTIPQGPWPFLLANPKDLPQASESRRRVFVAAGRMEIVPQLLEVDLAILATKIDRNGNKMAKEYMFT